MNAIILAAGMGTRLRPLTDDRPKSLVEVAGESFFARQLRQLRSAGVSEVSVVTGYMAEAFAPWRGQSGLSFVHNDHYDDRNNLWSMYLVRDRLADTLVLDGDVWLAEGVIPAESPPASCWFVGPRQEMRNEWVVRADDRGRVQRIDVASGSGWILSGLSYWTAADGRLLARRVEEAALAPGNEGIYWDEMPRRALGEIAVMARRIGADDWTEIDTLEDKAALEARLDKIAQRVAPDGPISARQPRARADD
ncbi:MAG TPA: NTP transferase domain-containing protein [Rectinemataceae bacterium]|nr:NTP transferase domain-containing protein [Rectinemataceae bacterium]